MFNNIVYINRRFIMKSKFKYIYCKYKYEDFMQLNIYLYYNMYIYNDFF